MIIEACVENFPESLIAVKKGANRLELCENLAVSGTTPSYGAIKMCATHINIPTLVMIRPRGGSFVYTKEELATMLLDIQICVELGVAGIVIGCLNSDNKSINYEQMSLLTKAAKNLEVTINRAYDEVPNSFQEVAHLKAIGVKRILSAGGKSTALDGKENLLKTLKECNNLGMELTVAGKITAETLATVAKEIPAKAFHGRSILGSLSA